MLTFAAMPRSLNLMHEGPVEFPAPTEMRAILTPEWLFGAGEDVDKKRFIVADSKNVSIHFNANSGRAEFHGGEHLPPLNVRGLIANTGDVIEINGNIASYRFVAHSYLAGC